MTAAGQRREAGAAGIREYGYGRKLNAANRPKMADAISRMTIQPRTTLISACATNPAASHPRPSRRNGAPETSTHLRTLDYCARAHRWDQYTAASALTPSLRRHPLPTAGEGGAGDLKVAPTPPEKTGPGGGGDPRGR